MLNVIIDVPFALPTIVAGLVLLSLYGPNSPLGVHWAFTEKAVFLALAFVTLPFVVRTVQPVLEELEADVEEAAASLGASRFTVMRRIILPSLAPAIAAGAALSFARAISEYGSLVLLSGNRPFQTEVVSVRVLTFIENGNNASAAALASVMLFDRPGHDRRPRHRPEAGVSPWLRSRPPCAGCCASWRSATSSCSSPGPSRMVVKETFANGLDTLGRRVLRPAGRPARSSSR